MKNINISFCDNDSQIVNVTVREKGGKTVRKRITLDSFLRAVSDSITEEQQFRNIGTLPYGYITGAISATATKECKVTLQLPAETRPVLYYNKAYTVPFPSIVFYLEAGKKGNIVNSLCYAATAPITPNTPLYHYPFGNVYDTGAICWGNIGLPTISALKDFEQLLTLFFSAETNDDLWKSYDSGAKTQREMLEKLSKMEKFPDEWLSVYSLESSKLF